MLSRHDQDDLRQLAFIVSGTLGEPESTSTYLYLISVRIY
jgi:hypothetical protein